MDQSLRHPVICPGRNCWRTEPADAVAVIIDADAYFRFAREAMLLARRRIMLIGWDFDADLVLDRSKRTKEGPESIGQFIHWLVGRSPDLEVFLLRWNVGAAKALVKPRTLFTLLRWMRHPRIHMRLDGHCPVGASQHQKIVVLDDTMAFCGGIDMTLDRWDTRRHLDGDPGRRRPSGASYGPWHDATTGVTGAAAAALGELARQRWQRAGGRQLNPVADAGPCWPAECTPDFTNVPIAISRTQPDMDDQDPITEIEQLYVDLIGAAQRWIYAESQYFASRRIARAIAKRLVEPDGPEVVLINPHTSEGWLEPIAMDTARAQLTKALRRCDHHDRLRLYHPQTVGGTPIYVHAKILIVDDCWLRIGSSNMNNRSMRLDTECDVTIDATASDPQAGRKIADLRASLLAEHLDSTEAEVKRLMEETGSLIAVTERLRRAKGRTLTPYQIPDLPEVEEWLADNEILDPEGPDEMFEPLAKRGLFHRNSLDFRIRHRGHHSRDDRPSAQQPQGDADV